MHIKLNNIDDQNNNDKLTAQTPGLVGFIIRGIEHM